MCAMLVFVFLIVLVFLSVSGIYLSVFWNILISALIFWTCTLHSSEIQSKLQSVTASIVSSLVSGISENSTDLTWDSIYMELVRQNLHFQIQNSVHHTAALIIILAYILWQVYSYCHFYTQFCSWDHSNNKSLLMIPHVMVPGYRYNKGLKSFLSSSPLTNCHSSMCRPISYDMSINFTSILFSWKKTKFHPLLTSCSHWISDRSTPLEGTPWKGTQLQPSIPSMRLSSSYHINKGNHVDEVWNGRAAGHS